jgi:hypothetical protein
MHEILAEAGGLFAILVFVHFVADWVFQTHWVAMNKHDNSDIRAIHCAVYTLVFVPVLLLMGLTDGRLFAAVYVLWSTHFIEDTYIPVYLWARYIRRAVKNHAEFVVFIETTLGKILMIAVDQIIHLSFLWVIVWLVMTGS